MSDLDDKLKAHVSTHLVSWMRRASWFFAGVAVGLLIARAFG